METKNNDNLVDDNTSFKNSEGETSFVSKVRESVSGLFNSSISKLFGNTERRVGTPRRRENDDDIHEEQPPRKKSRGVDNNSKYNNIHEDFLRSKSSYSTNSTDIKSRPIFTNYGEPVAGPSGITAQNLFQRTFTSSSLTQTEITNGEICSDSGDSTSGYSSAKLCSKKVLPVLESNDNTPKSLYKSKESFGDNNSGSRSLFSNLDKTPETPNKLLFGRSLSPQVKNTSLSSRKPSFNSSNFVDRTIATSRIINSPFYNGPTIYGGASAYSKETKESRREQLKKSFLVKPMNRSTANNTCTSLSKTARRILNTLEQYTTPISDSRKIGSSKKSESQMGLCSRYIGANPYSIKKSNVSSNKELQVPTLPELLNMKEKQKLQVTTDNIRHIATSSNSSLNIKDYKISEENQQKHANKLRPKISSVRTKTNVIEVLENVELKPVELTLPGNKLPKFDLVIPPPDCVKSSSEKKVDIHSSKKNESSVKITQEPSKGEESCKVENTVMQYTFSKPIVIADNMKSIIAINNFKFSEPLLRNVNLREKHDNLPMNNAGNKRKNDISDENIPVRSIDPIMAKFKAPMGSWECSVCLVRNKPEAVGCVACETAKSTQSLKNEPKTSSSMWVCSVCLIRNKPESTKCVACETSKSTQSSKNKPKDASSSFGAQFYKKSDEWECSTCLIRNKVLNDKCVACGSSKPVSQNGFSTDTQKISHTNSNHCRNNEISSKKILITKPFGDKFKPPSGSWECQVCLVRNKGEAEKCIACETKRVRNSENKLGILVKSSTSTWECDTCLIKNNTDLKVCAACETPQKIKSPLEDAVVKKESSKWECPTCMVRNDNSMSKCPCCETLKPNVTLISKDTVSMFNFGINKAQFSFGVPKERIEQSNFNVTSTESSKVTVSTSGVILVNSSTPVFTFGIKSTRPANNESKVEKPEPILPNLSVTLAGQTDCKDKPIFSMPQLGDVSSVPRTSVENNVATIGFQFKPPTSIANQNVVSNSHSSNPVNFRFGDSSLSEKGIPLGSSIGSSMNIPKIAMPISGAKDTASGELPALAPTHNSKFEMVHKPLTTTSTSDKNLFVFGKNNVVSSFGTNVTENTSSITSDVKPTFSFGNPASTSAKGFSFNSSGNVPKPSGADVLSTDNTPKQNTYLFAPQTTGTANSKNGGFNFGNPSLTNNQAAAFSFGANQLNTNATQPPSGGFNFSAPAPTTGGFNFNAPVPTFDANVKPSFNFTGGSTPVFAASPSESGEPVPVRKFKKAVRRAAQR